MKVVGITQRVEYIPGYSERRDCLDQQWAGLLMEIGFMPVPLPNISSELVHDLLEAVNFDALILSGGNSIARFEKSADDVAHERDAFEIALLDQAIEKEIPVLGVCRGMQMIHVYLGGSIHKIRGHVGVRHELSLVDSSYQLPGTVNSFHQWSVPGAGLADQLVPLAFDDEGNVEAFRHISKRLYGIMWHPERVSPFDPVDIKLMKKFLA